MNLKANFNHEMYLCVSIRAPVFLNEMQKAYSGFITALSITVSLILNAFMSIHVLLSHPQFLPDSV